MDNKGEIVFYQTEDNQTQIEVRLDEDTVWLNQFQMIQLFDSSKANISEHINSIYKEGELEPTSTVRKFRTVQKEGSRDVTRNRDYYNLDVIISVGYRIKSKRGTQFRIWANKVLKEYLINGFALNDKLLKSQSAKLNQLNSAIKLIASLSITEFIDSEGKDSFLRLLDKYSTALAMLDDYDYNRFNFVTATPNRVYILEYEEVKNIISKMKKEIRNTKYFGKEKDESLKSSISTIYQSFDGADLYPSIEEKASNLLYFLVKNHSFVDGNKRIAASIFLYFLEKNSILQKMNMDNYLLVALTLMIANSKSSDKDLIVNIVSNILRNS